MGDLAGQGLDGFILFTEYIWNFLKQFILEFPYGVWYPAREQSVCAGICASSSRPSLAAATGRAKAKKSKEKKEKDGDNTKGENRGRGSKGKDKELEALDMKRKALVCSNKWVDKIQALDVQGASHWNRHRM